MVSSWEGSADDALSMAVLQVLALRAALISHVTGRPFRRTARLALTNLYRRSVAPACAFRRSASSGY